MKLQFIYFSMLLFLIACGNENATIDSETKAGKPTKAALVTYRNQVTEVLQKEGASYEEFIAQFDTNLVVLAGGNYAYEVNFVELERMYEMARENNEAAINKLKSIEEIVPAIEYQTYALRVTELSLVLVETIELWIKGLQEAQTERAIENTREIDEVRAKLEVAQKNLKEAKVKLEQMIKEV